MSAPVRIAMWSGPRNISTAMMRAFENRRDCAVSDEPFYAAYLAATGLDHPMREAVLASQPQDWRAVAAACAGPVPGGMSVWYQKQMAHHLLDGFGLDWAMGLCNVFLIRAPEAVLASYVQKREAVSLEEIGLPQQKRLFDLLAERHGAPPPVVEAIDVLRDPAGALTDLCRGCGIAFDPAMLAWPAGPRASDGVWAPAWYDKAIQSTGFAPARDEAGFDALPDALKPIAERARPYYEAMQAYAKPPRRARP